MNRDDEESSRLLIGVYRGAKPLLTGVSGGAPLIQNNPRRGYLEPPRGGLGVVFNTLLPACQHLAQGFHLLVYLLLLHGPGHAADQPRVGEDSLVHETPEDLLAKHLV